MIRPPLSTSGASGLSTRLPVPQGSSFLSFVKSHQHLVVSARKANDRENHNLAFYGEAAKVFVLEKLMIMTLKVFAALQGAWCWTWCSKRPREQTCSSWRKSAEISRCGGGGASSRALGVSKSKQRRTWPNFRRINSRRLQKSNRKS